MRSVVDRNVVMRRMTVVEQLHSVPALRKKDVSAQRQAVAFPPPTKRTLIPITL